MEDNKDCCPKCGTHQSIGVKIKRIEYTEKGEAKAVYACACGFDFTFNSLVTLYQDRWEEHLLRGNRLMAETQRLLAKLDHPAAETR